MTKCSIEAAFSYIREPMHPLVYGNQFFISFRLIAPKKNDTFFYYVSVKHRVKD
jgi:hypothetical protein